MKIRFFRVNLQGFLSTYANKYTTTLLIFSFQKAIFTYFLGPYGRHLPGKYTACSYSAKDQRRITRVASQ